MHQVVALEIAGSSPAIIAKEEQMFLMEKRCAVA